MYQPLLNSIDTPTAIRYRPKLSLSIPNPIPIHTLGQRNVRSATLNKNNYGDLSERSSAGAARGEFE